MRKLWLRIVCIVLMLLSILTVLWYITLQPFRVIAQYSYHSGEQVMKDLLDSDSPHQARTARFFQTSEARLGALIAVVHPVESIQRPLQNLRAVLRSLIQNQRTGKPSRWVVVFMNNHELRPGGGFIGSLGFVQIQNYRLRSIEIRDVYELDGQLRTHAQPHFAVRTYLHKPSEHIRDSNFEPIFSQNARAILTYLQSVPPYQGNYDGVIGVTVTGFEKLLQVLGSIELTDYRITLTHTNVAEWLDRSIHDNFFPGSSFKRDVLTQLSSHVLRRLADQNPLRLFAVILDAVRARELVLYTADAEIQALLERYSLAGPSLTAYPNWILPVDANVGVNKVNASISKTQTLRYSPSTQRYRYDAYYQNRSSQHSYTNFFQLYLPPSADSIRLQMNGTTVVPEYDVTQNSHRVVGALVKISEQSNGQISVEYGLGSSPQKSVVLLQQIGNTDIPTTIVIESDKPRFEQFVLSGDQEVTLR